MSLVGFSPGMQVIDPSSGRLTRDGALLIQFMVDAVNGAGAVLTADGEQTLTGKTISGNHNTLTDIPTTAFDEPTGDGDFAVTATGPGTTNSLAMWSNGDLVDGPIAADLLHTDTGVRVSGDSLMLGPLNLAEYLVATVPPAADFTGGLIYVSDETGGATVAFSDGTNWRRVQDRVVVS